jgi:hypothetical protein
MRLFCKKKIFSALVVLRGVQQQWWVQYPGKAVFGRQPGIGSINFNLPMPLPCFGVEVGPRPMLYNVLTSGRDKNTENKDTT